MSQASLDTYKEAGQPANLHNWSDEYINYLYESSYQREVERRYDSQIQQKLKEEKAEAFFKKIGIEEI